MHRRSFIGSGLAGGLAALAPLPARAATPAGPRVFELTTSVDLAETQAPARLWLPLIAAKRPGQRRLGIEVASHAELRRNRDPRTGAELLSARWTDAGDPRRLTVVERVAVWDRSPAGRSGELSRAQRALWTAPSGSAADQALVAATARRIVGDAREPQARLRAIYDWVVATTWRDSAVAGCGPGDAPRMLREAAMGGKCADINGLVVCLARAAGLPAREVYGIRVADSARFRSLGRSGDVTGAQHCRAEAWLAGHGWFAIDPADVRKAVLEEKLAVDDPRIVALADTLFGSAEGNWAAYNAASSVPLPGAPQAPRLRFLMYPTAMTPAGEIDALDAKRFAYRITARELPA